MSTKTILMDRDGLTAEEADLQIAEAWVQLGACIDEGDMKSAYEICSEYFDLDLDCILTGPGKPLLD